MVARWCVGCGLVACYYWTQTLIYKVTYWQRSLRSESNISQKTWPYLLETSWAMINREQFKFIPERQESKNRVKTLNCESRCCTPRSKAISGIFKGVFFCRWSLLPAVFFFILIKFQCFCFVLANVLTLKASDLTAQGS